MPRSLLVDHLHDPRTSWSCGRFGAIAEFHRDPGEAAEIEEGTALTAATARGGLRVEALPGLRAVPYTLKGHGGAGGPAVALCLPAEAARMAGRRVVAELGPDGAALRPQDRAALLFDLGLGGDDSEICVRTAVPQTIALLRAACGRPALGEGATLLRQLPALSPHRVFASRLGRIEVYQAIPEPTGRTPEGPHTHVLPQLLMLDRTHDRSVPVPDGWRAAMTIYPGA